MRFGIMQGRLSPPGARAQSFPLRWRDEFVQASTLGFGGIEWLVTAESFDSNPVWNAPELYDVATSTGVAVESLCADCFIEQPLCGDRGDAADKLDRLIDACATASIGILVVPFLEGNRFEDVASADRVLAGLRPSIARADAVGVRLAIESDQPSAVLRGLAERHHIAVSLDLGNAAASGFDPSAEARTLGAALAHVHVKDRSLGGPSVMLGHGAVPFASVFESLSDVGYVGALILETPRGSDPVASAANNLRFVEHQASLAVAR